MKRLIFLIGCISLIAAFQIIITCSSPLDSSSLNGPTPGPGVDTIIIFDTVTTIDTIVVIDTITGVDTVIVVDTFIVADTTVIIDTVYISDTVTVFDTVFVGGPGAVIICTEINAGQRKIDWTFIGAAGNYHLEFDATPERERPTKALTINVNGQIYYWDLTQSNEFDFDAQFTESTTIIIMPDPPNSYGNGVSLCLTLQPK